MALAITRSVGSTGVPIWQGKGKDIQLAQGGFALSATGLPVNSIIPAGTPLIIDESARTASIISGGILFANASNSATTYQVTKGHTFKVGQYFAATPGSAAYAITAIDTSNAGYDVITIGTTLGVALTAGQNLFASTATGASAAALGAANALLYDDTLGNPGESVSAVIRGTVYARRIGFAYSTGLAALAGLKNIIFSQSK